MLLKRPQGQTKSILQLKLLVISYAFLKMSRDCRSVFAKIKGFTKFGIGFV